MATIQEKLARLEDIKTRIEVMVASGVDLNSPQAVPLGVEFIKAFDELAQEFGHKILVPLDKKKADFIRPDPATQI
jgi:hypothetical protein